MKFVFDQRQFTGKSRSILRNGEIWVSPTMISDLETQLMNFCDLLLSEVVFGIVHHPSMADKKRCAEAQILEKWRDHRPL